MKRSFLVALMVVIVAVGSVSAGDRRFQVFLARSSISRSGSGQRQSHHNVAILAACQREAQLADRLKSMLLIESDCARILFPNSEPQVSGAGLPDAINDAAEQVDEDGRVKKHACHRCDQ